MSAETIPDNELPEILLELVDPDGTTIGLAEKLSAHRAPGRLHRAFSVFLFDKDGRMLLQRRALSKYHSPGIWSNTCCGHPYPDEPPFLAATRRVVEELGVAPTTLVSAGTVTYRHVDPISELVEHEYNHLFVGLVGDKLNPNADEVDSTAFVDAGELAARRAETEFSSWFSTVLEAARPAIVEQFEGWRA
ncbi:isopentenyl-diphosphate Delta-isomerase [Antrihabitans spumae]|jgi:isopentenyl-diphosphate Delta-isomerase|uniref:Isopentenyl-diphosphate Delta-isomerase n=1 Tax=Antrihabitans spumae TaxID=3373370 RepID=A0ABW7KL93_9NOCA